MLALVVLWLGCGGLGEAARSTIRLRRHHALPTLALTGCGLLVWLTLILNAAGLFHIGALLVTVLAGIAFAGLRLRSAWEGAIRPPGLVLATVAVVVPIVLLLFIPPEINANDDGPAYLLFSEKLARLGASGAEPFSERRLYGFGGQFGLVALIDDLLGPRWLSLYEPSLGLALIGGWLLVAGRADPASTLVQAALMMGVAFIWLTLTGKPIANLAPAVLYAAFLFGAVEAWLRVWNAPNEPADAGGWFHLLAFYCAVALTLRPTAAPFIALLAISAAFVMLQRRQWQPLAAAAGLAALVLAPAMIASFLASDTLFYPFLGEGVHGPADYGPTDPLAVLTQALADIWSWVLVAITVGLWGGLRLLGHAPRGGAFLIGVMLLAFLAVGWATSGLELDRYVFPFVFAVFAAMAGRVVVPAVVGRLAQQALPAAAVLAGVGALGLLAVTLTPPGAAVQDRLSASALGARWRQEGLDEAIATSYRQAQAAVAPGDTILTIHLPHANRLDVRRNPIFAADQAATAGPPPGWPRDLTRGRLRDYLASEGIDHVAVSDILFVSSMRGTTSWEQRLRATTELARAQLSNATRGVEPVAVGPGFRIYRVSCLN